MAGAGLIVKAKTAGIAAAGAAASTTTCATMTRNGAIRCAMDRRLFREDLPRRLPIGPLLADHSSQARQFPRRLRQFRTRARGRFRRGRYRGLLADAGIVRLAARSSPPSTTPAAHWDLKAEFGSLSAYFWSFFRPTRTPLYDDPGMGPRQSDVADLDPTVQGFEKKRGWSFSSAPPPSTPSCRPWAWSMITWTDAGAAPPRKRNGRCMQWTDEAVILGVKRHGEGSVIAEVMTKTRGRHLGVLRNGRSRSNAAVAAAPAIWWKPPGGRGSKNISVISRWSR